MHIYIIVNQEFESDYPQILGVFATRELAEYHLDKLKVDFTSAQYWVIQMFEVKND